MSTMTLSVYRKTRPKIVRLISIRQLETGQKVTRGELIDWLVTEKLRELDPEYNPPKS